MYWLLKWFYGYKNFWDEILFFWLVNWLHEKYSLDTLVVEAGDIHRMNHWIRENKSFLWPVLDRLEIVPIDEYKRKYIHHIFNMLGLWKYKSYMKFFGGGEVLDEQRRFPHDGRNLALLYNHSIRKKKFVLIWGLGTTKKRWTKILQKYLLPRAQQILCREQTSYHRALQYISKNHVQLVSDFSYPVLQEAKKYITQPLIQDEYILININPQTYNQDAVEQIQNFIKEYKVRSIFFPGHISEDKVYYTQLKKHIPDLEIYDWTKHTLLETLALFLHAKAGIWARLHFLYPLKVYEIPYESIGSTDKIQKLIIN